MTDTVDWHRVARTDPLEVWRGPGDGHPVAFLHGIEDTWRSWAAVAARLPGIRPYAVRLPWAAGETSRWWREADAAEWVGRALEAVPDTPQVVVAHSFGATALLRRLVTGPDPGIATAVFVTPFYRPPEFALTESLRLRARGAFRNVLREGMRVTAGERLARLDERIVADMGGKFLERVMPELFEVFYDEFAASGSLKLAELAIPALVVMSSRDEGLTDGRARFLMDALPDTAVLARRRYGHFCHVEQAGELCRDIGDWLGHGSVRPGNHGGGSTVRLLDGEPTTLLCRPRYEGVNIRTWVGFKNFMYLVEEAVLEYFRDRGHGARSLYHRYGLGLEIVDSSVQLPMTLEADDEVCATVVSGTAKPHRGAPFSVRLSVEKADGHHTVLAGKVRVALVPVHDGSGEEPVPDELRPYVAGCVADLHAPERASIVVPDGVDDDDVEKLLADRAGNAYVHTWRAGYFRCHFSDRVQHSAYVTGLEDVVDRFLHDRGLGIGKLLFDRAWIPVVSRARVQLLGDAWMDETVHTVFSVQDVLKDTIYTGTADSYVRRGRTLVHTATATIVHGYAVSRGPDAGSVATLDPETTSALLRPAG